MQITDPLQSTSIFPNGTSKARSLKPVLNGDALTYEPEKTEEENRSETSTFSIGNQLSPEEENRVRFLTNLMTQLLDIADGQPSEQQKSRIREIEKELEKITGVKQSSSISAATDKMIGRKKDEDADEESQDIDGIDPKEAAHARQPDYDTPTNLGMQMLQRQASLFNFNMALDEGLLSSKAGSLGSNS